MWRALFLLVFGTMTAGCGRPRTMSMEVSRLAMVAREGQSIKVRQDACQRLGALGDKEAVPALVSMLDDEVLEWTAARSLGELKDPRASLALREHVHLKDGGV